MKERWTLGTSGVAVMAEMMVRKSVQNRSFMVDEKSSTDLERLNILGPITQNERNFGLRGRTEYSRDGDVFIPINFTSGLLNMTSCRFKVRIIDSVGCIAGDTRCLCYMTLLVIRRIRAAAQHTQNTYD